MICKSCGKQMNEGDAFCTTCGARRTATETGNLAKREKLTNMYLEYLRNEGYSPRIDSDGDVWFKKDSANYFISIDPEDEGFIQINLPGFWSIESEAERARVRKAALHVIASTKVAKVYPVRDDVWATIEMFCVPPENFKFVFERSVRTLRSAATKFADKMRE